MSHDATNWAIKQRGIKPALKVVLWNLCDRYHPDNGCFPSQDTLASDCEVPKSTLNVYLDELENKGLIARERRRRSGSQKQDRTRYRFAFEPDFERFSTPEPSPETGLGQEAEAESRNGPEPSPENGESRVQNLDSNLVREPVREPVNLRESARDGGKGQNEDSTQPANSPAETSAETETEAQAETPAAVERAYWSLVKDWPGFSGMPKEAAKGLWFALSPNDRRDAAERFAGWLAMLKAQHKTNIPAPSTYLRQRLWADVPAARAADTPSRLAAPFGKAWSARRLSKLVQPMAALPRPTAFIQKILAAGGEMAEREAARRRYEDGWPAVYAMDRLAAERQGVSVSAEIAGIGEGFHQVKVGGALWQAWERAHQRHGWPFVPEPGAVEWVYFPRLAEDGTSLAIGEGEFDDAIDAAIARFRHAVQRVVERRAEQVTTLQPRTRAGRS